MTPNEETIQRFYTSFQNRDYKTMQACYADAATFSDPVFVNLNAHQVRAMWEMFCVRGADMKIDFSNVKANETTGTAEWIATYVFSATGRKVVNHIYSNFIFENGKIITHKDRFDFYNWARQALGFTGIMLGWTSFVKSKVQKSAIKTLYGYMNQDAAAGRK